MLRPNATPTAIALLLVGTAWGCSRDHSPSPDEAQSVKVSPTVGNSGVQQERKPVAAATAAKADKSAEKVSRIVGKADVTVRGKPSCKIDFVYVGFDQEDLFWDGETCAAVTARMVDQTELERLGKWQRLDDFERRHVNQLPGGKVLYVEGAFTASIYPVGTTRLSYEASVAD